LLKQAFATVGARRELLVLVHELTQGNFKQFGGSLLVLAERMDLTSALFSRAAILAGGLAAGIGLVTLAFIKGAIEQQKFNTALFLTGNFSGQTAASFNDLAQRVHESAGVTVGAANDITRGFIETGRFGPQSLESVSKAAANLSRVTGLSADDVVKQFEGMTRGAANWAKETNEKLSLPYARAVRADSRA
jgi:phage-related minor tail protein